MAKWKKRAARAKAAHRAPALTPMGTLVNAGFDMANVYAAGANYLAQLALAPWSPPPAVKQVAAVAVTPAARRRPATLLAVLSIFALCSFALARAGRGRAK